jgi:cephalosporin-C deacetylase
VINDFDRFFLHLPPLTKEEDFSTFWNYSISELKGIPLESAIEKNNTQSEKFDIYNASFSGYKKYRIKGELYLPKAHEQKSKIIILIHDYNLPVKINIDLLDKDLAYFVLLLRGHDFPVNSPVNKEEPKTLGFMTDNLLDKDSFYLKQIYLDALRSIDFLRLNKNLDCKEIGIIGKGLGAAAAVFAASQSSRITSLVLDSPSFCYLELFQNFSKSDAANEINSFILNNKSQKIVIKKNLSYFDAINHLQKIIIPVLACIGLRDVISPPECAFALFNHLKCDKTAEIFPEDDHSAGGDSQFQKSIQWIKKLMLFEN